MKRQWLWFLLASLGVALTIYGTANGRGNGHSSQYAVGRAPVRSANPGTANPGTSDYLYGATANDAVEMILKVPSTAELWFNGAKTTTQGKAVRHFVTPALEPGQDYTYDIRVRWQDNGRPVEHTRRILVRAGDRITLNLMDLPAAQSKTE